MPSRASTSYFGAGPAPLPTPVLERASSALLNFNDTGLGLGEISHRSPTANKILSDAKQALRTLLDVPDDYEILFMQGGGSGGFAAVVQNLVGVWVSKRREELGGESVSVDELKRKVEEELKLDYIVTGSWSAKAAQEAVRLVGEKYVNVAVDAREGNNGKFGTIPAEEQWKLTPTRKEGGEKAAPPAFVYFCDNETVDGVEFPAFPKRLEDEERLVVADMSSNFLSRRVDVGKYAVIFCGAQKNVGLAGITITLVRKSLLPPETPSPPASLLRQLNIGSLPGPIILDYATTAKNNSLYNTLPIFNLWVAGEVMAGLVQTYGTVEGQEKVADEKAGLLYGVLDKYPAVYHVVPEKSVRSRMNVCFRVHGGDAEREKAFVEGAEKRLLFGIKGHRSVGGMRVSNYNAVSVESVRKLVGYLEDFAEGRL